MCSSCWTYGDGTSRTVALGERQELLPRLQQLPGFDNEAFINAMSVSGEGMWTLWRR